MDKKQLHEKRDQTIRGILDAATEIFAEVGFAGARVDEIAKRAGVNKAMIYYRIGDKEALYAGVLHNVFSDTLERITRNIKKDHPPEEKLKTFIANLTSTVERYPYLPSIMMQEIASGGQHLPAVVVTDLVHVVTVLMDILEEGVTKGVFIETNPIILHFMLAGTMVFYHKTKALREKHGELNEKLAGYDQDFPRSVNKEIERLLMRAITVEGAWEELRE